MDKEAAYQAFFKQAFGQIREQFEKEHLGKTAEVPIVSESLSKESLEALSKISSQLPQNKPALNLDEMKKAQDKILALSNLSVDVFELQTEKRGVWTLVKYGWSLNTQPQIRFRGEARVSRLNRGHPTLKNTFNLSNEQFLDFKRLKLISWGERFNFSDPFQVSWWVIFYPYHLLGQNWPERYLRETYKELIKGSPPTPETAPIERLNFQTLYQIKPELQTDGLKADPAMQLFPGLNPEDLAAKAVEAILIPPVPEEIKQVFQTAKKAVQFGYYYYPFFTVAIHYSALALESSIVQRYNVELTKPEKVTLKGPTFERELAKPTHKRIEEISRANNTLLKELTIQPREVAVKGKLFPHSRSLLSDWLAERKITSRWEVEEILKFALKLRNTLSHREAETNLLPEQAISFLKSAAYQINKIFHNI